MRILFYRFSQLRSHPRSRQVHRVGWPPWSDQWDTHSHREAARISQILAHFIAHQTRNIPKSASIRKTKTKPERNESRIAKDNLNDNACHCCDKLWMTSLKTKNLEKCFAFSEVFWSTKRILMSKGLLGIDPNDERSHAEWNIFVQIFLLQWSNIALKWTNKFTMLIY